MLQCLEFFMMLENIFKLGLAFYLQPWTIGTLLFKESFPQCHQVFHKQPDF